MCKDNSDDMSKVFEDEKTQFFKGNLVTKLLSLCHLLSKNREMTSYF